MISTIRIVQLLILCLISIAFATPAVAQSWTSANGKHTIEAEFVQQKDDKVQLKKESNGKLIWVELKKLSKDDQERAKRLQKEADKKAKEASKSKDEDLDQIELECTAAVKESKFGGEKPQVVVSVIASGPSAAKALRYGKIKLAKFMDGDGKKLTQEEDRFSFDDLSKSFKKIDRESMFSDHPDDGVAIEFKLPADVNPEMIGKISGTFSIMTGGEKSVESMSNLSKYFGKTIKSDALKKSRLKIEVEKPSTENNGYSLSFNVSGNLDSLNRIWVGDADEEKLEEQQGSSNSSFGKKANYSFFFTGDVSEAAVLHVETVEGAVESKILFDFSDVEVAKK